MSEDKEFRLRDVAKRLGDFTLGIRELNVPGGQVLALVGPTGSGKTTLLRLLAGLLSHDDGDLRWSSQPFATAVLPISLRRRITLVHQRPLMLTGTVRFNVEYGLRLRRMRDYDDRVDATLERLRLAGIARQSASTLSGGQIQLVALARALVIEPEVLLLDEPTAHLDPARVALVEDTIHEVWQVRRPTIVWATHNLFQARRVASHVAFLWNGQLVEAATADEFFTNPSDPRTAEFVQGRMVY